MFRQLSIVYGEYQLGTLVSWNTRGQNRKVKEDRWRVWHGNRRPKTGPPPEGFDRILTRKSCHLGRSSLVIQLQSPFRFRCRAECARFLASAGSYLQDGCCVLALRQS